jgi:phosphate:Na+ symporter
MQSINFDFWMFIAGLGVFLFGMFHLENGLKGLAGKSFRTLLQRFTNKSWKGILTGASVTAILQSSSLVTLLVAAFLGSGMITFQNSLGVVFGANLGTTVTAWIVATLGFKLNIADFSFPFLALGTLSYIMLDSRPVLKNLGSFLIGFGLLFLGLDYMKTSIEKVAGQVDLSQYAALGRWVFLLIGIVITALIQSSSATIVIVLSALNAGLIDIYQSVAMMIGAHIGTTSTLILASLKGTPDKKRLAAANVSFKLVTGGISFFLLDWLVYFTQRYMRIEEPLMELVFLNTLIILIGIFLFYPFLGPLGSFMKKRFRQSEQASACLYITNATPEVPDVAMRALDQELQHVFALTRDFILNSLGAAETAGKPRPSGWSRILRAEAKPLERYEHLKRMEDELTYFYVRLQEHNLSEAESAQLSYYMHKLRAMIYAAKNIKDVAPNIREMDESDDALSGEILSRLRKFALEETLSLKPDWQAAYEQFYHETVAFLYRSALQRPPGGVPVSTLTNAIKKTVSAVEELTRAVDVN